MKKRQKPILCPYCGRPAILRKASDIYKGPTKEEYLYVCSNYPACDSYVGVHRGTKKPKGSLADKELRKKRILTHQYFDSIWKHGILDRKNAYFWLQDTFFLTSDEAHIGQFSSYMCDQVISASKRILENNKIAC